MNNRFRSALPISLFRLASHRQISAVFQLVAERKSVVLPATLAILLAWGSFTEVRAQNLDPANETPTDSTESPAEVPTDTLAPPADLAPKPADADADATQLADDSTGAPEPKVIELSSPRLIPIDLATKKQGDYEEKDETGQRFRFGSYGRVQPAMDLRGGAGKQTRIVYPSPRVDEASYAELELGYRAFQSEKVEVDTVLTLGLDDTLFHYNGEFDSAIAVRNLYGEARNFFFDGSFVWAGSRMLRGDDVYLMDFWPLDNLNTYGAGLGWRGDTTRVGWHAGVNRLNNAYQYQVIDVIPERFVGEQEVVFLDRQKFITSLQAEQQFGGRDGAVGFKVKAYGEVHALPEGTIRLEQPRLDETLPDDSGWKAGLEFGVWNFLPRSFANLFLSYSRGLAAYGVHAVPFGVDQTKRAADASQLMLALSANVELPVVGFMVGGFMRTFTDADRIEKDFDDGWDTAWSLRAMARVGDYFTPGVELSQQFRRPNGLNPATGKQELATVTKLSVLPALTFGEGMYARPQIRLNYTVSLVNEPARMLFPVDDPRRGAEVEHFLGVGLEWWFNSSSYGE